MRENDWVLNVHCRECGIGGTALVGNDRRILWPRIVHESDCALAEGQDLVESVNSPAPLRSRERVFAR